MNTGMRYRNASPGKKVFIILLQLVMLTYVLLIIYPLFNMVMSSFKSTRDIMLSPFSLPESFSFENYVTIWLTRALAVVFSTAALYRRCDGLCGAVWLHGRLWHRPLQIPGNTLLYMLFLSGIMLPLKAAVIPLFQDCEKPGLVDNRFR